MEKLRLVSQAFLVAVRPHALATLMFRNFRFTSFFQGTHIEEFAAPMSIQTRSADYFNWLF